MHERWVERKSDALKDVTEEQWRMFRVLFAAGEHIMGHPSHHASAARLLLELPSRGRDEAVLGEVAEGATSARRVTESGTA